MPPATLSFLDGSFLRGEVESLNSEGLRWRHPNARHPIEFSLTNLNLLRLPPRQLPATTNGGPVCRVVLASGDEFEGQLLSLDADSFEMETWFAGKLRGQRAGLQSLAFYGSSQTALYDGPRAADEWRINTGAATVNRVGVEILGGRNIVLGGGLFPAPVVLPAAPAVPQFRLVEPGKLVERRAYSVEEIARLRDDAERSGTVAVFLKTDLVKEALKAGHTSEAALEKWFADFKDPNDWAKDEAKAARFKVMLRAEVDVLVRRFQGRAAPFVEAVPVPAPLPLPVVPGIPAPAAAPAAEPMRPLRAPVNFTAPPSAPAVDPVAQAVKVEVGRVPVKGTAPTDLTPKQAINSGAKPQDTVAQLKAELAGLGERVPLVVRQGIEQRFKALEARLPAPGQAVAAEFEQAVLALRMDVARAKAGLPPMPPVNLSAPVLVTNKPVAAADLPLPAAQPRGANKPAAFDIVRMSSNARFSPTIETYLKSDLVQLAVESGLVKADAVKAELDKQVAAGSDVHTLIRREGALLAARLLRELEHFKNEPVAATLARTQDLLGGVRPAGAPPAIAFPAVAGGDAAQWQAAADISQKVSVAALLGTGAELLKSDLMKAAVEAGLASLRAEEEWLDRQERNLGGGNENLRAAQMKLVIQAEAMQLGIRLLMAKAPLVSAAVVQSYAQSREQALAFVARQAEARAVGNVAADVLAQARVRAMDALQLNNPNLALAMGAEGALAGRAAVPGAPNPNAAWTFRDGAYYSTGVGTLGRECQLPTKARIEFDLAWKGQPYFRFSFYTRSPDNFDFNDGMQFYISSTGYIYSMRRSGMGATSSTGARVPQMLAKNNVRFTFLVDAEAETATLLADGEKVHEWKSLGSPGSGTGIVFYNYNANSRVRVSDIRVAPWDGRGPAAGQYGAPGDDPEKLVEVPPADSAVVEFINKDRATGTLHSIRDGKLAFTPAGTKLEIPLARAALIAFPVSDAPVLPKVEGVQVTLHRNERLTLVLEKWEAAEIVAVSPVFGRLKLKPEAIRSLRFNPTAPRGVGDEWGGP